MLMMVEDLMSTARFNDAISSGMTDDEMWDLKFRELFIGNAGFLESVQANGVLAPIAYDIQENVVYDGHHRLLCAWLLGQETIEIGPMTDEQFFSLPGVFE